MYVCTFNHGTLNCVVNVSASNGVHPVALALNLCPPVTLLTCPNIPGSPSVYQVKGYMHKISVCAEEGELGNGARIGNGACDPYIYTYYAVLYRRISLIFFLEDTNSLAYDVYCEYY